MKELTPEDYLMGLTEEIQEIIEELRTIIKKAVPEASEYAEKDMLAYALGPNTYKHSICVISGYKNHATLGFIRGIKLKDPQELLQGEGKTARHLKLYPGKEIPGTQVIAWLKEASEMIEG